MRLQLDSKPSSVTGVPSSEWPWVARTRRPSICRRCLSFSATHRSSMASDMPSTSSTAGTGAQPASSIGSPDSIAPWRSSQDRRLLTRVSFRMDPEYAAGCIEALREERWVLPPRERPLRQAVEARAGPCDVVVEVEGWDVMQRFVALGAGITVVNQSVSSPCGVARCTLARPRTVAYRAMWRAGFDPGPWLEDAGLA